MGLISLGIRHFRNLSAVDLEPSGGINVISGPNASGKTSLLEAIYFLGRARSFRTSRFDRLVESGAEQLQVFGRLEADTAPLALGIERSRRETQIRIGGRSVSAVSALAAVLPLQLVHPNSHRLLEEGPQYRRRFLDWGVFHVEPAFFPAWQRYQRALRQRNAALRSDQSFTYASAWDQELVDAATAIDAVRRRYVKRLGPRVAVFTERLAAIEHVTLAYRSGWPEAVELAAALQESRHRDREAGHTTVGPHRADLQVNVGGVRAAGRVSRGQQKLLVGALLLAQAALFHESTGKTSLILVDDLAAELDAGNRRRFMDLLTALPAQSFVTAIDPESLLADYSGSARVFHVEHGRLQEMV